MWLVNSSNSEDPIRLPSSSIFNMSLTKYLDFEDSSPLISKIFIENGLAKEISGLEIGIVKSSSTGTSIETLPNSFVINEEFEYSRHDCLIVTKYDEKRNKTTVTIKYNCKIEAQIDGTFSKTTKCSSNSKLVVNGKGFVKSFSNIQETLDKMATFFIFDFISDGATTLITFASLKVDTGMATVNNDIRLRAAFRSDQIFQEKGKNYISGFSSTNISNYLAPVYYQCDDVSCKGYSFTIVDIAKFRIDFKELTVFQIITKTTIQKLDPLADFCPKNIEQLFDYSQLFITSICPNQAPYLVQVSPNVTEILPTTLMIKDFEYRSPYCISTQSEAHNYLFSINPASRVIDVFLLEFKKDSTSKWDVKKLDNTKLGFQDFGLQSVSSIMCTREELTIVGVTSDLSNEYISATVTTPFEANKIISTRFLLPADLKQEFFLDRYDLIKNRRIYKDAVFLGLNKDNKIVALKNPMVPVFEISVQSTDVAHTITLSFSFKSKNPSSGKTEFITDLLYVPVPPHKPLEILSPRTTEMENKTYPLSRFVGEISSSVIETRIKFYTSKISYFLRDEMAASSFFLAKNLNLTSNIKDMSEKKLLTRSRDALTWVGMKVAEDGSTVYTISVQLENGQLFKVTEITKKSTQEEDEDNDDINKIKDDYRIKADSYHDTGSGQIIVFWVGQVYSNVNQTEMGMAKISLNTQNVQQYTLNPPLNPESFYKQLLYPFTMKIYSARGYTSLAVMYPSSSGIVYKTSIYNLELTQRDSRVYSISLNVVNDFRNPNFIRTNDYIYVVYYESNALNLNRFDFGNKKYDSTVVDVIGEQPGYHITTVNCGERNFAGNTALCMFYTGDGLNKILELDLAQKTLKTNSQIYIPPSLYIAYDRFVVTDALVVREVATDPSSQVFQDKKGFMFWTLKSEVPIERKFFDQYTVMQENSLLEVHPLSDTVIHLRNVNHTFEMDLERKNLTINPQILSKRFFEILSVGSENDFMEIVYLDERIDKVPLSNAFTSNSFVIPILIISGLVLSILIIASLIFVFYIKRKRNLQKQFDASSPLNESTQESPLLL